MDSGGKRYLVFGGKWLRPSKLVPLWQGAAWGTSFGRCAARSLTGQTIVIGNMQFPITSVII